MLPRVEMFNQGSLFRPEFDGFARERGKLMTTLGCVVDVETTGLGRSDEIVEIGLVLFAFEQQSGQVSEIIEEYDGLREPTCAIHPGALCVHGLTMDYLRGMCVDAMRVEDILSRTQFLIAHNASFDRRFVVPLFPSAGTKPWYCSMSGIDWRAKGAPSKGLQNLLSWRGIEVLRAHRAVEDARATLELLSCQQENGRTYLHELVGDPMVNALSEAG
jgi:DNA polymerase-3 subunit epsilon